MKKLILYTALLLTALMLTGCAWLNEPIDVPALSADTTPSPSPTATAAPQTPASTPRASTEHYPYPLASPVPSPSDSATPSPVASPSGSASPSPSASPSASPSPKPSASPTTTPDEAAIAKAVQPISPADAKKLIGQQGVVLLDVRDPYEYQTAHIAGAVLLPYYAIAEGAPGLPEDKDATIIVYCRSGRRSAVAAKSLAMLGYNNIRDLGALQDWPYDTVS